MINLTKKEFIDRIRHEKENYEYVKIPKTAKFDIKTNTIADFENFNGVAASSNVAGAYLARINPNAHLNKFVSKFTSLETRKDPANLEEIDPSIIAEQAIRYCELNREDDLIAVKDKSNDMIMGVVTNSYNTIQNCDIYTLSTGILDSNDIAHEVTYEHDWFQMRMNIRFPDHVVELDPVNGQENEIELRMSIFNGMTGIRALGINVGSWEQVCTNGAMGLKKTFEWKSSHLKDSYKALNDFSENIVRQLRNGDKYLQLLENASEITTPIFRENDNVIKILSSDKFKLLKKEAEEVFRRMKHHKQYKTNAFGVGRAIAEVARDTHDINRRMDLEQIAGDTMLLQVLK